MAMSEGGKDNKGKNETSCWLCNWWSYVGQVNKVHIHLRCKKKCEKSCKRLKLIPSGKVTAEQNILRLQEYKHVFKNRIDNQDEGEIETRTTIVICFFKPSLIPGKIVYIP